MKSPVVFAVVFVVAILAAAVAVYVFSACFVPSGTRARRAKVEADVRRIHDVAAAFRAEKGRWPRSIEEILIDSAPMDPHEPKDPWGGYYCIAVTSDGAFAVLCLGRDGRVGGSGEDEDVGIGFEDP